MAAAVLLLCLCACAEERGGSTLEDRGETVERGATTLPGRWVTADEQGVLTFYRSGQVTLEQTGAIEERAEPLSGTYAAQEDGRIRLDFPSFTPIFVVFEDEDVLSLTGPNGLFEEGATYRKVSDLPEG